MGKLALIVGIIFINSVCSQKPWEPTPRPDDWWMQKHQSLVEYSQNYGEQIKVIFIGSSLVEYWGREGLAIWNERYAPVGSINYGIGGDKTENVIWRIQNGELDGISPKFIVVYIGSNNVPTSSTSDEIVTGVLTVLSEIRRKLPDTKILYVCTFPRLDTGNVDDTWNKIGTINENVLKVVDNTNIWGLDMFWDLAEAWGVLKEGYYLSDRLHFTQNGYNQWYVSMNETFHKLLDN